MFSGYAVSIMISTSLFAILRVFFRLSYSGGGHVFRLTGLLIPTLFID